MAALLDQLLSAGKGRRLRAYRKSANKALQLAAELDNLTNEQLAATVRSESTGLEERLAAAAVAAKRALGLEAYPEQLMGAQGLLDGYIVEMKTGEGKTLTAALAASVKAAEGEPVHVATANEYLASRDAQTLAAMYELLGLSCQVNLSTLNAQQKQQVYGADVVYSTASELGFDYLRDHLVTARQYAVQVRGLGFALVDEADSLLLDDARTPLIITMPQAQPINYQAFCQLVDSMERGQKQPEEGAASARQWTESTGDYEADEKEMTVGVTARGIAKAEQALGIPHLYQPRNAHLLVYLNNAIKAKELYSRDRDYAVIDGKLAIIDKNTGRVLQGRKWSDGLHQALEAKEGLQVTPENATAASVAYNNFFRRYRQISGMSGTAASDEDEFISTYGVEVVEIPTHRPVARIDHDDLLFRTAAGRDAAAVKEIARRSRSGQPVLVGTASVEHSERLSALLDEAGVEHQVLNAMPEHAAREALIVAQAGRPGAVTVATNMAGRGVDIKLGGDPEMMLASWLEKLTPEELGDLNRLEVDQRHSKLERACQAEREMVLQAGGLMVLGTEKHDSRRIDDQLRGRAGRQGEPGESLFLLSCEDRLVRLFGGERMSAAMARFEKTLTGAEGEEEPIKAKALSKRLNYAQQLLEDQRLLERRRTAQFDDVLDMQRQVIYAQRDRLLEGEDVSDLFEEQLRLVAEREVEPFDEAGFIIDPDELAEQLNEDFGFEPGELGPEADSAAHVTEALADHLLGHYRRLREQAGDEDMKALQFRLLLTNMDMYWMQHLNDMSYLRQGIGLRGIGGERPLMAYQSEGFRMFEEMSFEMWREIAGLLTRAQITYTRREEPQPATS